METEERTMTALQTRAKRTKLREELREELREAFSIVKNPYLNVKEQNARSVSAKRICEAKTKVNTCKVKTRFCASAKQS